MASGDSSDYSHQAVTLISGSAFLHCAHTIPLIFLSTTYLVTNVAPGTFGCLPHRLCHIESGVECLFFFPSVCLR